MTYYGGHIPKVDYTTTDHCPHCGQPLCLHISPPDDLTQPSPNIYVPSVSTGGVLCVVSTDWGWR